MSEVTGLKWSRKDPWLNIENNARVRDGEYVECFVCHDEAVVISNDGRKGLCWDHYEQWCEAQPDE